MNLLAESKHYAVYNEYESVILEIKGDNRKIQIGDFYGDPQMAIISEDENVCIMCGCGLIIYYLREPYMEYTYHTQSKQWSEWGRSETEVWIESIKFVNGKTIEVLTEAGENITVGIWD